MKAFLTVAFCLIFTTSNSEAYPATSLTNPNSIHASTSCPSEYSCVDNHTLRICAPSEDGSFRELYRITCAGDYSWCDPGSVSCVPGEPPEYLTTTTPAPVTAVPGLFTCMEDGYFPDVSNCSRYFDCVGEEPFLRECSGSTPYYAFEYQSCQESLEYCANSETYGVQCNGDNPNWFRGKQKLGSQGRYFYYCSGMTPVAVDRCFGAYRFNMTSGLCEPYCPHAGLFPSAGDCARYYRCSPVSGDLYETEFTITLDLSCPEGQGFLEEAFQCVDSSLVSSCDVSSLSSIEGIVQIN